MGVGLQQEQVKKTNFLVVFVLDPRHFHLLANRGKEFTYPKVRRKAMREKR
jgi:hypothetical protein